MRLVSCRLALPAALAVSFAITGDAGAQNKAAVFTTPPQASPATTATPAPPLPGGCAAPSKLQCADANWYKTGCAAAPATKQPMLNYCTWVFKNEWFNTPGGARTTLFPTAAPSLTPIITPARRIDRGKAVTAGTTNRPVGKRRFGGLTPPAGNGTGTTSVGRVGSLNWTPRSARSSNGSFASMSTASYLPLMSGVDRDLEIFRAPGAQATNPTLMAKANDLNIALTTRPQFITQGPAVNSCEEYAFKRWGDYSTYSRAAKMLGRNWRQIYNAAMDPQSPVFINKQLAQYSVAAPTPKQIIEKITGNHWPDPNVKPNETAKWFHDPFLPLNAYFAVKPTWIGKPGMNVSAQDQVRINQAQQARSGGIRVKSDTSPLGIHREAKTRFDTVYGNPHDDEFADIAKRKKAYHTKLAERMDVLASMVCAKASDPCFKCSARPAPPAGRGFQMPAGFQKIRDMIGGWPVINPADLSVLWQTGNAMQDLRSLTVLGLMAPGMQEFESAALGANSANRSAQPGGQTIPMSGNRPAGAPGGAGAGGQQMGYADTCIGGLAAQGAQLEAQLTSIEKSLSKLLVNELSYGDRGCLANPGSGNANICEWSYELFASETAHLFDEEVEQDFQGCRADITAAAQAANVSGFSNVTKVAANQALVFPCVWRGDFTGNAPNLRKFIELNGSYHAKSCEVWRQQAAVQQQQQSIADDMSGMKWKPADGEIYDDAVDSMTLGERASLGAYFDYATDWKVKRTGRSNSSDPMSSCMFEGSANSKIAAGIYFFDEDLELLKFDGGGTGKAAGLSARATFTYLDIETFSKKTPLNARVDNVASESFAPVGIPKVNLGGGEVDFWVTIGPVPVHIVFGAVATAGVSYQFTGKAGNNCSNLNAPTNLKAISTIEPWVRADAYADASIDVVVASAGVRLDLLLLRLGMPLSVNVTNTQTPNWRFANGGRISIDMLSGRLTGYVEVGVAPLEESFDATIFAWDGFHTDVASWGLDKNLSNAIMRVANAYQVTNDNVKCVCDSGANFCCSGVPCLTSACASSQKKVNGVNQICSFTQADVNAFSGQTADPIRKACSQYVR